MCGISGIVTRGNVTDAMREQVTRMDTALIHRGPDGNGRFDADHVSMAVRRLGIIDIQGGDQPLTNEAGDLTLIANGEIYNYVELTKRLRENGHAFKSRSDCEVILHLYEEHGLGFVNRLRGMFALALYDHRQKRIVFARDRMGEKPLYLWQADGSILFASEMKALLQSRAFPFELDVRSVNMYFHYQYVPEPRTMVAGVRKLDAGNLLVVNTDPWTVEQHQYWSMKDSVAIGGNAPELIREKLDDVGRIVVRSDRPVGVALSGGIDSSVVAAMAARSGCALEAFTVGYEGRPASDERFASREFASGLGIPFHEVELSSTDIVSWFPELNYYRDDPIADIAGLGYFAVMKKAQERGVPVMLQGQGGDELFWGYNELREAASAANRKVHAGTRSGISAFTSYLDTSPRAGEGKLRTLARLASELPKAAESFRTQRLSPHDRLPFYDFSPDFRRASESGRLIYGDAVLEQLSESDPSALFTGAEHWDNVDVALTDLICATYLRCNGVAQGDRLSMACSVEMRLPLLDHELVETVIGLRKTQSDSELPAKSWLKSAVADLLPAKILNAPKRGFAPPTRAWHEALFHEYGDTLSGGYLVKADVLSKRGADELMLGRFERGASTPMSFKALVLEQWCRQMVSH